MRSRRRCKQLPGAMAGVPGERFLLAGVVMRWEIHRQCVSLYLIHLKHAGKTLWYIAAMMSNVIKALIDGDAWFADRVEALLKWLEEWLSISQKWAERATLALYVVLIIVPEKLDLYEIGAKVFLAFWLAFINWHLHRRPESMRNSTQRNPMYRAVRAVLGLFLIFLAAALYGMPRHLLVDFTSGTAQLVYLVFFYMTDITSNGERGRKRKLALAELKKLFGTEWIPKPVTVPG